MSEHYDLIVIGGGPGGYSSAIAASKSGLRTALFEKSKVGGTCLNVGCIPTKFLLDKAAKLEEIRNLTELGIFREAGLFSFRKIQERKAEAVEKLSKGVASLLRKHRVTLIQGEAHLEPGRKVRCEGKTYTADHVIIATGSKPMNLSIPGAEWAITSEEALNMDKVPERLVVIGGGVIGLELASAFTAFGSEVVVIEMMPELLASELPQAAKTLTDRLRKRGIVLETGSTVRKLEKSGGRIFVIYEKDGRRETAVADQVLMAVGRRANLNGIDAVKLGLALTARGEIAVDAQMRTNLEGVYAIGDVTGGYQLAHAAYAEGYAALTAILGGKDAIPLEPMPRCIYTLPGFAAVGMTAKQAEDAGFEPAVGSFPFESQGMAAAVGASGMVYVVMDKATKKTLGVHIVGNEAHELIALGTLAVKKELTLREWETLIVAHPSLAETVKEAALETFGRSSHK